MTANPNPSRAHYIWLYVSACLFLGSFGLALRDEGLLRWLLPLATGAGLMTRISLFRDARRQEAEAAARHPGSAQ
jgi:hypothetical protein